MNISLRFFSYMFSIVASALWGMQIVAVQALMMKGVDTMVIAGAKLYVGIGVLFVIFLLSTLVTFVRSNLQWRLGGADGKGGAGGAGSRIFGKGKRFAESRFGTNRGYKKTGKEVNNLTMFWISAVALGLFIVLSHWCLRYTVASDAGLIMNFAPLGVLFLSAYFIMENVVSIAPTKAHFMKIVKVMIVGAVLSAFVLAHENISLIIPPRMRVSGDVLAFLSMILFAVYIMAISEFMRSNRHFKSSLLALMSLVIAAVPVSFLIPWTSFWEIVSANMFSILIIGGLTTGLAFWFWYMAAKRLNVILLAYNLIYLGFFAVLTENNLEDLFLPVKLLVGGVLMICSTIILEVIYTRARRNVEKGKTHATS